MLRSLLQASIRTLLTNSHTKITEHAQSFCHCVLMSTWHGVMADGEEFMQWKISTNTVYNTLKTDTKYSHSVRSRPTLKDKEYFRNGLVRKTLREISL